MKKHFLIVCSLIVVLLLATAFGCAKSTPPPPPSEELPDDTPVPEAPAYTARAIDVYRDNTGLADTSFAVRFYEPTPNVPYVGVSAFYREFFKLDPTMTRRGGVYTYTLAESYLKFDVEADVIGIFAVEAFSDHVDFTQNTSNTFLFTQGVATTPINEKSIDLSRYGIAIYGAEEDAYVPLGLLSSFSGGTAGYNVAYNGRDVYVLDVFGELTEGEVRNTDYYEGAAHYSDVLEDMETPRPSDLAAYVYGQLCFNFDNLRGYTSQLVFGDDRLVELGTDSLLTQYYPTLKEGLLSTDMATYQAAYLAFFSGMFDGGHTGAANAGKSYMMTAQDKAKEDEAWAELYRREMEAAVASESVKVAMTLAKYNIFVGYSAGLRSNAYYFDEDTRTAYVIFDSFDLDYTAWDNYYSNGFKEEDLPDESKDAYLFVRNSLYRALDDEAVNVVLDISTNGGGDSGALCGIVGLLNGAQATFEYLEVVGNFRYGETFGIDVNLDGTFDDLDVEETSKFNFRVAVLTSECSFSCGNLLPYTLKELGYKIIGRRSGGGSCAITYETTADGMDYYRSSWDCLTDEEGRNIDAGIPVDFELPLPSADGVFDAYAFYDLTAIANYLNSLE